MRSRGGGGWPSYKLQRPNAALADDADPGGATFRCRLTAGSEVVVPMKLQLCKRARTWLLVRANRAAARNIRLSPFGLKPSQWICASFGQAGWIPWRPSALALADLYPEIFRLVVRLCNCGCLGTVVRSRARRLWGSLRAARPRPAGCSASPSIRATFSETFCGSSFDCAAAPSWHDMSARRSGDWERALVTSSHQNAFGRPSTS